MNKLIIALSVACASACVFADTNPDTNLNATPSKVTTNGWFSAKVESSGEVLVKGSFATAGDAATDPIFDKENKKIVIDSELDKPVTFNADPATASDMATVNFTLDTAIVPSDARHDLTGKGAKVAFAASEEDDTKSYYAWLGEEWTNLGGNPKGDGEPYDLAVTFKGDKVQFKVDGAILKDGEENEWLSYTGAAVPSTMSIDFVGSGNVASFIGSQLTIEAEIVVPVDCGPIEIKEEDMKKFEIPSGTSKDAFFAGKASTAFSGFKSDISVGAAYALGLIAEDKSTGKMAPVNGGELIAKVVADANVEGIKLGLNVEPPDTGATISYSVIKAGVTAPIVETTNIGSIVIQKKDFEGLGLKKFTVRAIVSPAFQGEDAN